MAVTITRSIWIDDDGTGQTGTVINQALHTTLYNEIDTALAKVAQLAGGNAFTGNQTIATTARLLINAPAPASPDLGQLAIHGDLGAVQNISLTNAAASFGGNFMVFLNNANTLAGSINHNGTATVAFVTTSDRRLKTDGGRATDLEALRAVVVHDFTWIADGLRDRGVFAQDVAPLFPRAVVAGTDDRTADGSLACPWMTDYNKFVPDLIVGWQQHDADLAELRAILAAVKG